MSIKELRSQVRQELRLLRWMVAANAVVLAAACALALIAYLP